MLCCVGGSKCGEGHFPVAIVMRNETWSDVSDFFDHGNPAAQNL